MSALGWLFVLSLGSPAFAGDTRAAILDLLGAYEDGPTADQLRALGDGVGVELLAIAQDPTIASTRRARAVTALQAFPSDAAVTWITAELGSPAAESILRRKCAWSLGVLRGEAAVPALAGALADPDPQLRIAAAHALGSIAAPAAKDALKQRLDAETDATVRAAVAQEAAR
jgi:HEAT repeat protein